VFTKQGFRVTPAPCGYVAQSLPREGWNNIDLLDFLPNHTALQHTTEAVTEVAGIIVYWLAGKL
jgi:hypothetical protein